MDWLWLIVDIIFIFYFTNLMAHEMGWWSARSLSFTFIPDRFGKKNILLLIAQGSIIMLWFWLLFDDVGKLIG